MAEGNDASKAPIGHYFSLQNIPYTRYVYTSFFYYKKIFHLHL